MKICYRRTTCVRGARSHHALTISVADVTLLLVSLADKAGGAEVVAAAGGGAVTVVQASLQTN